MSIHPTVDIFCILLDLMLDNGDISPKSADVLWRACCSNVSGADASVEMTPSMAVDRVIVHGIVSGEVVEPGDFQRVMDAFAAKMDDVANTPRHPTVTILREILEEMSSAEAFDTSVVDAIMQYIAPEPGIVIDSAKIRANVSDFLGRPRVDHIVAEFERRVAKQQRAARDDEYSHIGMWLNLPDRPREDLR